MSNVVQFVPRGAYQRSEVSTSHYEIPYETVEDLRDWLSGTEKSFAVRVCLIWLYESHKNALPKCMFPVDKWDEYTSYRRETLGAGQIN